MGVPRNKIDWYPRIDYNKCDFCMECDKFCPHDVYGKNESNSIKLTIDHPNNCVVFCRACSKACPQDALSFPDKQDVKSKIKEIREGIK
ncbi:MAG: 4Fe-4S binding protein [Candidatus Lokiarchaeota archaeon]